jgi:hypothetical protein
MNLYILINVVLMGILGIIWEKSNVLNLSIKVIFIAMSIWGIRLLWFTPIFDFLGK